MKMVLDETDRKKPWYKGMYNMNDEELDEYWREERKNAIVIVFEMLILIVVGVIFYFIDEENGKNVIFLTIGMDIVLLFLVITVLDNLRTRIRLVKEE